ncbi:MAG: hypothetical protein P4N41_16695 [Negativicutes bacterium]|nr:hypothetical protein [Negativicutes bacterium]MDR3591294.1 hypothetical protein [Negativicutes bacterium]
MDELNLQLFNDGDGEDDGIAEMDSVSPTAVEKIGLDASGDVKIFYEEPAEAAPRGMRQGTPPDDGEQACYSPEEVRSADFEKLDPSRIPSELLPWYKSMQAGFTKKTQELAQQRRAVQEVLEQAKGGTPAVREGQEANQADQAAQLTQAARGQVEQYFHQKFDEFNPSHQAALTMAVQQIHADVSRAAGRQENLVGLESELRAKDPNFDTIYEFAKSKVTELPYRDYVRLQKAFSEADVGTLKRYYDGARKSFYAGRQSVATGEQRAAAPRLEGAGSGGHLSKAPPDFGELGKLKSFDDKLAWLRKHNIKP